MRKLLSAANRPTPAPAASGQAGQPGPVGVLLEWHAMKPAQQQKEWAELVAWVTWLHDRYELSAEEKLPLCWAQHPGLIEELRALKTWRQDIYTASTPGADQPSPTPQAGAALGQAARYWHGELRQVLHAAATQYAAGCRAAHRSATTLETSDPEAQSRWLAADRLMGIPTALLTAAADSHGGGGQGTTITAEVLEEALHRGAARPLGETVSDYIHYDGTWWTPEPDDSPATDQLANEPVHAEPPPASDRAGPGASGGPDILSNADPPVAGRWRAVTDPVFSTDLDTAATRMRAADAAVQHQPRPRR